MLPPGSARVSPRNEAFYRDLVDRAGDLMFTVDEAGLITFVNATVTRALHYSDTDLIGRPALDLVREDRRADTLAFYRRQVERGLPETYCEVPVLARHGATVWLAIHARVTAADAAGWTAIGIARDVTDRKRAEDALRESEERYRQAFDENLAGIYVISPSGQVRSGNPAFVRIYGFPSVIDALGANLGTLYPDSHLARLVERVRQEGAVQQQETTIRRVDGSGAARHRKPGRPVRRCAHAGVDQRLRVRRHAAQRAAGADAPGAEDGSHRSAGRRRRA